MRIFFVLFSLLVCVNLHSQDEDTDFVDLGDVNYSIVKLGLNSGSEGLTPFFDSCKDAKVVYTGENHLYTPFNNLISLTVLKELNLRYRFKDHIIELGPARSQLINAFLKGDSLAEIKLKASTSYSHFMFCDWLKKWNDTIEDDRKIEVHGIDVERFNEIPLMNIGELFEGNKSQIPYSIEALRNTAIYRLHRIIESGLEYFDRPNESYYGAYSVSLQSVREMVHTSDSLGSDLKTYFAEDYNFFREQIMYLKEYIIFKGYDNTPMEHNWRETHMFGRLNELMKEYPEKKFYGQFGRCHSIREVEDKECEWFAFKSTMERIIRENPGVKTVSMGMFYGKNRYRYYDSKYSDLLRLAPSGKVSMFNLRPKGEATSITNQFDFALVNDQMLERLVPRNIEDLEKGKKGSGYNQFSMGFEYWPVVWESGIKEVFALDSLSFPAQNIWQMGFFTRVKLTNRFTSELGYSQAMNRMKDNNAKGSLKYNVNVLRYNVGYTLLEREKIEIDLHLGAIYAVQKLRREVNSDSTFGTSAVSKFRKQDVYGSAGINVQCLLFPGSYLSLSCDYTQALNLGKGGWSLNNSAPEKYFGTPQIKNVYASPIAAQIKWGFLL